MSALALHTPGPWFVTPDGHHVTDRLVWFDEDGARCGETPNIVIECPTEADSRLVAAAPDMLEELRLQSIAIRQEIVATDLRRCMRLTSLQIRLDRLEQVIAKAEGRT